MAPPCHCSLLKWSSVTGYVREYFLLKIYLYKYETDNEPERGIEKTLHVVSFPSQTGNELRR